MNWLTDEDIDLAARTGISVVHCPQWNQRLGSGICPVSRLRAAGVNVALGTDGAAASAHSTSFWSACRLLLASLSTHNPRRSARPIGCGMATLGGARRRSRAR